MPNFFSREARRWSGFKQAFCSLAEMASAVHLLSFLSICPNQSKLQYLESRISLPMASRDMPVCRYWIQTSPSVPPGFCQEAPCLEALWLWLLALQHQVPDLGIHGGCRVRQERLSWWGRLEKGAGVEKLKIDGDREKIRALAGGWAEMLVLTRVRSLQYLNSTLLNSLRHTGRLIIHLNSLWIIPLPHHIVILPFSTSLVLVRKEIIL